MNEALSRLLSGDLPPDEAAAWRARIGSEPEVAAAWAALRALRDDLAALPEVPPPPSLDARVVRTGPVDTPRRAVWPWVAGVAVAAAIVWALRSPAPSHLVVERGSSVVEGSASVLAGGVPVDIDGSARLTVEPAGSAARVPGGEVGVIKELVGFGAGAVAGSLLTVAVWEGTARVRGESGDVVVSAGEVVQFPAVWGSAGSPVPDGASSADRRMAALEAENEALRKQLEASDFAGAVARGQVAATQGEAVPWPADPPDGYAPDEFEATLRGAVAKAPGFEVESIDCSEFPCVAMLTAPHPGPDWEGDARRLQEGLKAVYPGGGIWVGLANLQDEAGNPSAAMGFAVWPWSDDENLRSRTGFRASTQMQELEGGR